jgi:hypothetical protein
MKTCLYNKTRIVLSVSSACLALGSASLFAGDGSNGGFYMNTDAGVNMIGNLSGNVFGNQASVSFDPGVRADIAAGYAIKLNDQFSIAPEFELGITYNSVNASYNGNSGSGDFIQVPLLANAVLNWHITSDWTAYAGGGGGYDYWVVSGGNGVGSSGDMAWQIEAGIKYKVGSGDLGLGYKYLDIPSQSLANNAIMLSYTFHF